LRRRMRMRQLFSCFVCLPLGRRAGPVVTLLKTPVARRVEKKRELIREGVRSVGANPPDCTRELQSGSGALGGKGRGIESAEKGDIAKGGLGLEDLHGFGAVAAAWLVDDAAEGLVRLAIVRGC